MAIRKERLQELRTKKSKVYVIDECVKTIELDSYSMIVFGNILETPDGDGETDWYDIEHLYEHKADAEWDLEFDNVEKRIKFVKPKPFREVESVRNKTVYDTHGIEMYIGKNNIFIRTGGFLFEKPFNEENYTEACILVKKLFMED